MIVLTPSGYKNIEEINIGDEIIAYDINTGQQIINLLLGKDKWTADMDTTVDEEGNVHDNFYDNHGDFTFYLINNTWRLYKNQSIWANMCVTHASSLQIGDIVYNGQDEDVIVSSIEEVSGDTWWRLSISGDHSYIADGLTLHNASRYWVKQNASANWNVTGSTNWGSASNTADNASVPTSADDVFFDGAGASGNTDSVISATITILSLTISSGYTATMTHNAILAIAGNVTLSTGYTISGTSQITISAASIITSNGKTWPNAAQFNSNFTITLNGNFVIAGKLSYNNTAGTTTTLSATTNETLSVGSLYFYYVDTINGNGYIILKGALTSTYTSVAIQSLAIDGTVTFPASFTVKIYKEIKYLSGTVGTVSIGIYNGATIDTYPLLWNGFNFYGNTPFTINSLLLANSISVSADGSAVCYLQGNYGFETNTINLGRTLDLKQGLTYVIKQGLTAIYQGGFSQLPPLWEVRSNHASQKAILTLNNGATCNSIWKFTRIDASGGRTINTYYGTVTDCVNIRSFSDLKTVAASSAT